MSNPIPQPVAPGQFDRHIIIAALEGRWVMLRGGQWTQVMGGMIETRYGAFNLRMYETNEIEWFWNNNRKEQPQ